MYKSFNRADFTIKIFWLQKTLYTNGLATRKACPTFNIKFIFHDSFKSCWILAFEDKVN